jgi:hypothetical protein
MEPCRSRKLALQINGDRRCLTEKVALIVVRNHVVLHLGHEIVEGRRGRRRAESPTLARGRAAVHIVGHGETTRRNIPTQNDPERRVRIAAGNQLICQVGRRIGIDAGHVGQITGGGTDERDDEDECAGEAHGELQ